jgi:hypothetical protein
MINIVLGTRSLSVSIRSALITILVFSSLLRITLALFLGGSVEVLPGIADQKTYHVLAQRVLNGHGFSFAKPWWPATPAGAPTAHWSYLYTFYLAFVYKLVGVSPLIARLLQALLVGILQPYLAFKIGERVFNQTVGVFAAAITAFYTYFIYYAAALMTEAFYITALMGFLYLSIRLTDFRVSVREPLPRTVWINTIGLGVTLGIAVLLRQLILLFVPLLFIWLGVVLKGRMGGKRAIVLLLVIGCIIALFIVPFSIHNQSRFRQFVLLNTNAGFAFFWANHPIYGIHFQPILSEDTVSYGDLIPDSLISLNEAELDQALLTRGLEFVRAEPVRYILLSISRIPAYFKFWPSPDSSLISNISRVMSFGITLPFMLFGIVQVFRSELRTKEGWKSPSYLLLGFVIVYSAIHLLSWSLIRYRLPVDAILIVFAAYGISELLINWSLWRGRRKNEAIR